MIPYAEQSSTKGIVGFLIPIIPAPPTPNTPCCHPAAQRQNLLLSQPS